MLGRLNSAAPLAAIAGLAVVVAGLALAPGLVRPVLALVVILIGPGYLATTALPIAALDLPTRIAVVLGTSLSITALLGLALNWAPGGLSTEGWLVAFGAIWLTIIWRARAVVRDVDGWPPRRLPSWRTAAPLVTMGSAVLIAVLAVVVARQGELRHPYDEFTQLSLLPVEGRPQVVRVAITSEEADAETFRLELTVGGNVIQSWEPIALEPGGSWETEVALPLIDQPVTRAEADLYRTTSQSDVYRRAWLVIER